MTKKVKFKVGQIWRNPKEKPRKQGVVKMTYRITYKGKTVKEYPHKLTCIIWLMLKGLVYENYRWGKWIDPDYKIKEIKDDCFTCPRCHSRRCNTGKTKMGFFKVKCLDCKNQWGVRCANA